MSCTRARSFLLALSVGMVGPRAAGADETPWRNPFAADAQPAPARFSGGLRAGSVHGTGLGFELGVTTFPWLEAKVSYAFYDEHSFVGFAKASLVPTASLTPYLVAGYGYGISNLRRISLRSHHVVGGLGLQGRFADRFYIGGELTARILVGQTLYQRGDTFDIEITDAWGLAAGFVAGVWFP
ncbi:MAG: hypothetical protein JST00_15005 [Deltaproteobacteria bacterium]|nr:hypothetical protein [Deltaproteobacteria bacterium]